MVTFVKNVVWALSVLPAVLMFTIGPASAQTEIPIRFDSAGCPVSGSVSDVGARRGNMITWQAYDQQGAPTEVAFKLYFDPLQGPTLRAPRGRVSRAIDDDAPRVDYKYTIVGDNCEEEPLDPNIRVD